MTSKVTRINPDFEGNTLSSAIGLSEDADISAIINVKNGMWNFQMVKGTMTRYEFIGLLHCIIDDISKRVNDDCSED